MVKVELLNSTLEPELLVATAAKLCYSKANIKDLMDKQTPEGIEKFINMLAELGHESPMEHVSFTFAIEGISRVTEVQLVRHRIASYSIKSGRYVKVDNFEYSVPPAIANNEEAKEKYTKKMEDDIKAYEEITELLISDYLSKGFTEKEAEKKAIEDARYLLPQALNTKLIVTMNARSLINFFQHRCCNRAQWEIRELANKMRAICKEKAPTLFRNAGATCLSGICLEGKMQCRELKGKIPTM